MKIALFLEPDRHIKRIIAYWKNQFKNQFKNAIYLNHPIHLTLFTLDVKSTFIKDIMYNKVNFNYDKIKKFEIDILGSFCFYNDPITKLNTLHYKVNKNKNLNNFQISVLKDLKNYKISNKKNYKFGKESLNKNFQDFGYPFLGSNWLPHFTICSINKKDLDNELIKRFFNSKLSSKIFISKYSFWLIDDEKHIKIKDYYL